MDATRAIDRPPLRGAFHQQRSPDRTRARHTFTSLLDVHPFRAANLSIARERLVFVFKPEEIFERASTKRVREHLRRVLQHEERVVTKRGGYVTNLHPTLGYPSHVLGYFR